MSVQSKFFKKTTIMYNTIKDKKLLDVISPITQNVSILCDNEEDLFDILKNEKNSKFDYETNINDYIQVNASELFNGNSSKIMNNLNNYYKELNFEGLNDETYSLNAFINFLIYHMKNFIMFSIGLTSYILIFLKKKYRRFSFRYVLGRKKWPKLKRTKLIAIFKQVSINESFIDDVKIKKHYSGFFKLQKK